MIAAHLEKMMQISNSSLIRIADHLISKMEVEPTVQ